MHQQVMDCKKYTAINNARTQALKSCGHPKIDVVLRQMCIMLIYKKKMGGIIQQQWRQQCLSYRHENATFEGLFFFGAGGGIVAVVMRSMTEKSRRVRADKYRNADRE